MYFLFDFQRTKTNKKSTDAWLGTHHPDAGLNESHLQTTRSRDSPLATKSNEDLFLRF
jgi:hypothetical protein